MEPRPTQHAWAGWLDSRAASPETGIGGNFRQIPFPQGRNPLQKREILAEMLVRCHPTERQLIAFDDFLNHFQRQFWFRMKNSLFGNPALLPTRVRFLLKPTLMHIQTFIDKCIAVRAGVDQEDPFLAIRHFAQMT